MQVIFILFISSSVLSTGWNVIYPPPICAARGSNVTIACTFTYTPAQVQQVLWCSVGPNHGNCLDKPHVYDSEANNNQRNFQYIGDKTSNCSLLISNINQKYSGEYRFRFITDLSEGRWTGNPGVKISVHDVRLSITSSRENGSIVVGDSLSLTCKLDCRNLSEVQWFKNGDPIQYSHPILTFSGVTTKDSGNYSCSLRNFKTTVSEELRIYIEDAAGLPTVLVIVVSLASLVFITAAVMLLQRMMAKGKPQGKPKEEGEESQVSHYSTHQTMIFAPIVCTNIQEAEDVLQEVQYASVNIQPKELLQMSANTEHENNSAIYSTVMLYFQQ
ncbi:hypothetical protein ABG768_027040 [Culter alburnus]|uniref:Ig-like domain-containing protein n=1 Tax=Culter alburnus TaxID=194366 RepID=A0AAW2AF05_CULAL